MCRKINTKKRRGSTHREQMKLSWRKVKPQNETKQNKNKSDKCICVGIIEQKTQWVRDRIARYKHAHIHGGRKQFVNVVIFAIQADLVIIIISIDVCVCACTPIWCIVFSLTLRRRLLNHADGFCVCRHMYVRIRDSQAIQMNNDFNDASLTF